MTKRKKKLNRRQFIARSLCGAASMGLLKVLSPSQEIKSKNKPNPTSQKEILCRPLGPSGISLPIVSMGVMNAFLPELVKRSYEVGIRHFDTAAYYQRGRNEEMVGQVIKELNARDRVIIGTKIFVPHEQRGMPNEQVKEFFLKTANESLKRLQTDYVDILYVHNVSTLEYLHHPAILEVMRFLKKEKKARLIGFSTHQNMTELITDAAQSQHWDVILTSFNYAMNDDQKMIDALGLAASKKIGLIAMKTQCSQYWYRQGVPADKQGYYEGAISQQAVLKWALRHPFITTAIPGFTALLQVEEDFAVAYDLELTAEEKKFLSDRQVKSTLAYCRQCQQCRATCPRGVDIPTLMRAHLYATCYANFYQMQDTLDEIPTDQNLKRCLECHRCQARCRNRIDIAHRIADLKNMIA